MNSGVYRAISAIVPPDETAGPQAVTMWRAKIFGLALLNAVAVAGVASVVFGWIGPGFASHKDVIEIRATLIESRIVQHQDRFCQSRQAGNTQAQRFAREQRDRLRVDFYDLLDRQFLLPTCEDLGFE
jgi:hypothetical protein